MILGLCTQCGQADNARSDGPLYVEWSDMNTVGGNGCVAEMFCSWGCAASWFSRGRPRQTTQTEGGLNDGRK